MQSKRQISIFSFFLQNSSVIPNLHYLIWYQRVFIASEMHTEKKIAEHIQGTSIKLCIIIADPARRLPEFRIFFILLNSFTEHTQLHNVISLVCVIEPLYYF